MKKWMMPVLLTLLTIYIAVTAAAYSLIGQTNDNGDFVIDRKVQALFVLVFFVSLFFTIKAFRKIKSSKNT